MPSGYYLFHDLLLGIHGQEKQRKNRFSPSIKHVSANLCKQPGSKRSSRGEFCGSLYTS